MRTNNTITVESTVSNQLLRPSQDYQRYDEVDSKRKQLPQQAQHAAVNNDQQPKQPSVSDMTRRMICGGLAGMIAKTVTNPLERIKMLSQTGDHLKSTKTHSVIGIYKTIIEKEGILGLWAGNGANLVRIFPAKAVVFSTNDLYRSLMLQLHTTISQPKDPTVTISSKNLPTFYSFLAGGLAGMSASLVTYPLDFARGRISGKLASAKGHKTYSGIIQTCVMTVQDEGFLALYKGVTPTLLGAMPYEGIKFGTVGLLEQLNLLNTADSEHQTTQMKATQKMIYGSIGGVMAGVITYPNDTVRRLLQIQGSRGNTNIEFDGYWDCVRKTYQREGIQRFYRGAAINIIRMAPNTAIQFGSYELLKNWTKNIL